MIVKQVIVMRKDLKMRRGKEIAQGAHAAMALLSLRVRDQLRTGTPLTVSDVERAWLEGSFTKVCVQVDSEDDLRRVHARARELDVEAQLIIDSGRTEFNGVPTPTCCAIGPDLAERVDAITEELKLY
jgi:PTH2 family peptidyl-tRNA hydrolase